MIISISKSLVVLRDDHKPSPVCFLKWLPLYTQSYIKVDYGMSLGTVHLKMDWNGTIYYTENVNITQKMYTENVNITQKM